MDEERILAMIDKMEIYITEMDPFIPEDLEDYLNSIAKRRVCERSLQLSVACVIDICGLFVKGLRLGTPSDEDNLFEKLRKNKVISGDLEDTLKGMKGFRNVLVHRYLEIDDSKVYKFLKNNLKDFERFKKEILDFLKSRK